MAERRMFAKTVIDSDAFLDMPLSSQALYFHLAMRADDEGFMNNPKKITKMVSASEDDYNILVFRGFIIPFQSGVIVIKHWRIHNYIQKDRLKQTVYKEERGMLQVKENGAYTLPSTPCIQNVSSLDAECVQDASSLDTQVRLDKDRLGKDSINTKAPDGAEAEKKKTEAEALVLLEGVSDKLRDSVLEWLAYKRERRQTYTSIGMKKMVNEVKNHVTMYGEDAVIDVINKSMSNNYQGITFKMLEKGSWNGWKSKPVHANGAAYSGAGKSGGKFDDFQYD